MIRTYITLGQLSNVLFVIFEAKLLLNYHQPWIDCRKVNYNFETKALNSFELRSSAMKESLSKELC
ncbi:unnamed protein product [Moneuplotes crassus]|uniref:Uncharacterized protein n=1 Tax=Euplotes crassus TaxID=5936 RepID=A0AAD2D8W9_EUPCR|nr:unnamed protein product [Moneuplotes crassus]